MDHTRPISVWIDCDTGHDDAFALLLGIHDPHYHVAGISTCHGNADLVQTTRNAHRILTALQRPETKVYAGAARPFSRPPVHAVDIHGKSGLDGTDLLPEYTGPETAENAVEAMQRAILTAHDHGNPLWMVVIGPLTNAALLFSVYPELVGKIAGLSIMGGAFEATSEKIKGQPRIGNITPWAEFNIHCDPEAAQAIFSSSELTRKTIVVPLDVSHTVIGTPKVQGMILRPERPNTLRRMYHELLTFFGSTYRDHFGMIDGPPVHDPLALVAVLPDGPLAFDDTRWHIDVVTSGEQAGRTVASRTAEGVCVPSRVDLSRFWSMINQALDVG